MPLQESCRFDCGLESRGVAALERSPLEAERDSLHEGGMEEIMAEAHSGQDGGDQVRVGLRRFRSDVFSIQVSCPERLGLSFLKFEFPALESQTLRLKKS